MTRAQARRILREADKRLAAYIAREREIMLFFVAVYRARRREAKEND